MWQVTLYMSSAALFVFLWISLGFPQFLVASDSLPLTGCPLRFAAGNGGVCTRASTGHLYGSPDVWKSVVMGGLVFIFIEFMSLEIWEVHDSS